MGVFRRSWQLFKESFRVLNSDIELLLFPVLGACVSLLAMVFVLGIGGLLVLMTPALYVGLQAIGSPAGDGAVGALTYLVGILILFVFYLVGYFVTTYFTGGLIGAALIRLRGGAPTFGDGMRIAGHHVGAILGYAVVQATVGVVISLLRGGGKRRSMGRSLVAGAAQTAWNVATFLAIPYLVDKGEGPLGAIKASTAALKRTFGEQIVGSLGVGIVFTIPILLVCVAGVAGSVLLAMNEQFVLMVVVIILAVLLLAILAVLSSALNGIYRAAVYLYAEEGLVAEEFNAEAIRAAFQPAGA